MARGRPVAAPRTPLTYYGGKQRLARQIVPLLPPHDVYLEPFAGGAAILFAKPRAKRETLNDADGQIVRFWRAVRDHPDALADALTSTPYSRGEWRSSGAETSDDVEAARMLLVNVDQSFGRSRGSYAVPALGAGRNQWQPATWANLPPKVLSAAERLHGVALEHGDALALIPKWDRPGALIYVDPPYAGEHRLQPSIRYAVDDDGTLWPRLVGVLLGIRHASVVLSGYPCVEAERLGWRMVPLDANRTVQSSAGGALPKAPEVVWINYEPPETP